MLEAQGRYVVEAPDIVTEDWEPNEPLDVVITSLPVRPAWGRVVIALPEDFAHPVVVSAGGLTVLVDVVAQSPLQGIVTIVDLVTADATVSVMDALHGISGRRVTPAH